MKYIYLVNRFIFKEKTDLIVSHLKDISIKYNRDFEIIINDDISAAKNNKTQFKDTEYIITALGGDGSINHLLNDFINTKNILSYIPIGTGNDFYHANQEDLTDGIHEVDAIKINDRYFINVACFGIDADIANDDRFIHNNFIPESMRYNAGVVYYFLTYKPKHLSVIINDQTITQDVTTIVVANAKYYGGGYNVAPTSRIDDGKLEVYVVDKLNKIKMANLILSMKTAGHLNSPSLKSFTTDKLTILSDKQIYANIDGERLLSDRFDIEIIPKAVKLHLDFDFINEIRKIKYR